MSKEDTLHEIEALIRSFQSRIVDDVTNHKKNLAEKQGWSINERLSELEADLYLLRPFIYAMLIPKIEELLEKARKGPTPEQLKIIVEQLDAYKSLTTFKKGQG
jgi:hypothetical protein